MTNSFSLLQEEDDDTSTNNSRRKLEKMIRKQEKNPTDERAKNIKELDAIVNPPKTIPKKNKKKNKTSVKKENKENEKQKIRDERFKEREKKRKDKELEEKRREENYEQCKREQEEKDKKRNKNKMLSDKKVNELINEFSDEDLIKESRQNNFRSIKNITLLMLSEKDLPSDVIRIIMQYLKKQIYVSPLKSLIQPDLYDYIRRKFKNNVTERKLKLRYHPDKNNNVTNQLFIFMKNIMDTKYEL